MKKVIASLICLCTVLCFVPVTAKAAPSGTINVYNWGQYISDGSDGYIDVNKAFTEATGIQVNYMTFESNETMYTKLKTGGSSYDIIIPSDYMVSRLIAEDMLEEINFDNIPNYEYVDDSYKNLAYDPDNKYSVPYTWGTVGIIYNTKYVDESDVGSWDLMWNQNYNGKILMFDNPRDAFAIAELRLGYSLNTEDENELRAAADLLKEQKPVVQQYVMDQIFAMMEHEEAWIGAYYAGDYLLMLEENEDLAFCYPEEGFNLFVDAVCIPKGCKNKEAAEAYINFLCDPEINAENLEYLGYSTPISEAKQYMDPEITEDPIAYPDAETLASGQSFMNLSEKTNQLMDELWLEVKTASTKEDPYAIVCLVFLIVIVGGVTYNAITKRRRKARRGTYAKSR